MSHLLKGRKGRGRKEEEGKGGRRKIGMRGKEVDKKVRVGGKERVWEGEGRGGVDGGREG